MSRCGSRNQTQIAVVKIWWDDIVPLRLEINFLVQNFSICLPWRQKNLIQLGQKIPGYEPGQLLIYCRSEVRLGWVGSGPISTINTSEAICYLVSFIKGTHLVVNIWIFSIQPRVKNCTFRYERWGSRRVYLPTRLLTPSLLTYQFACLLHKIISLPTKRVQLPSRSPTVGELVR